MAAFEEPFLEVMMHTVPRNSALAVGLLSLFGCTDSEPLQQSKDDVRAFGILDSGAVPIVRSSTGSSRDAGSLVAADATVGTSADGGAAGHDAATLAPD